MGACILGSDLRVGDTIAVWWAGGRDTITTLRPYTGPLVGLFVGGAQLATFAINQGGMTIDNAATYDRISSIAALASAEAT